jgi:predicted Rossmann fold nucleotide-binding protein DprA/Smf involved in DNA uptake
MAALLLCGRFGKTSPAKPLTAVEYERLAEWLAARKRGLADLLEHRGLIEEIAEGGLEPERVRPLLERGMALGLAVERWARSGVWILSRADDRYPQRLKGRLGSRAPVLLYGAGEPGLLDRGGLAVVGSRNASPEALTFARDVGVSCSGEDVAVISGGARGVDSAAMRAALESGGSVVGVLAESLLQAIRRREDREGIETGRLTLVSANDPEVGFSVGSAMGRNKYIYALADHALVVQTDLNAGGTWAGAVENLRHRWVPLFVGARVASPGCEGLIRLGAEPFAFDPSVGGSLKAYLRSVRAAPPGPAVVSPATETFEVRESVAKYERVDSGSEARPEPSMSMYEEFLRRLSRLVGDGRGLTQKDIASALELLPTQVKTWLTRAEKEKAVVGRGRPKRYCLAEPRLFE